MKRILILVALGVLLSMSGCSEGPSNAASGGQSRESTRMAFFVDISGSTDVNRKATIATLFQAVAELHQRWSGMEFFRFMHQNELIFQGIPDSEDSLASVLQSNLKDSPDMQYTYYLPVFEEIEKGCNASVGNGYIACVLGDGVADDIADKEKEYATVIGKLAKSEHLKRIIIWGVSTEGMNRLRKVAAPLGSKLVFLVPGQDLQEELQRP